MDYKKLVLQDLEEIRQKLELNHPGNIKLINDKFFIKMLDKGYNDCVNLSEKVNSYSGYYFLLKRYINNFQDTHLDINIMKNFNIQPNIYPGFIAIYINKKFIVVFSENENPSVGSEIISCDGKNPIECLQKHMIYLGGIITSESEMFRYSPYLFVDSKNPFIKRIKKCIFLKKKKKYTLNLNWHKYHRVFFDEKPLISKIYELTQQNANLKISLKINKYLAWICIPKFSISEKDDISTMNKIISSLPKFRNKKKIIFDLRGNTGGDENWQRKIFEALYGNFYHYNYYEKKTYYLRVSEENIKLYKEQIIDMHLYIYGKECYDYDMKMLSKMKEALKNNEEFIITENFESKKNKKTKNPVKAKIYVITDYMCMSSCPIFLDKIKSFPNVIHIGLPSQPDTKHHNPLSVKLKSGFAKLTYPCATTSYRKRDQFFQHIPDIILSDISNTSKIINIIKKN